MAAGATALGGRLAVGTHLPLLGRRYRYLSLLGEGASAQARLPHQALSHTLAFAASGCLGDPSVLGGGRAAVRLLRLAGYMAYGAYTRAGTPL